MNLLLDRSSHPEALLVLEDGTALRGRSCGASGEVIGPLVLDTDIFGYQRALGASEHAGALVAFTYPQVGNFGVNAEAPERPCAAGMVVHDMIYTPSNWQCEKTLPDYLAEQGIVGIEDIDVRALAARLRGNLGCRAILSTTTLDRDALLARLQAEKGGEAHA